MERRPVIHFQAARGQTPLNPDEAAGLIPDHISLQRDLDELEQANILAAEPWLFGRKHGAILTDTFIKAAHKQMFGKVWTWAGSFRRSDKNLGCTWTEVPARLQALLGDAIY